ncbi:MAG: TIGR03905 family TSCPD domain-containing protein [Muribaculaceae bacterium]|nr:TIGR03905 family TSCPD domain-containing protein [Muribaculaceae bacterium]
MTYRYVTSGTCSRLIEIDIDDNKISDIRFVGGCHGNLQGISALTKGMNIDEVIDRLRGIRCGNKATSCPDQLALALEEIKRQ